MHWIVCFLIYFKNMSYISAIGTANPSYKFDQSDIANFMEKAMQLNTNDSRKLRTIFKATGIKQRYSILEDYGRTENFSFYPNTHNGEPFPSTNKRLKIFKEAALPLSLAAVENLRASVDFDPAIITNLIVVCCTGMYAPGLDIELVQKLLLPSSVQRTCITFMGCYAAFNALKVADAFCKADENAKVLIVCTELCSLHFQKEATDDNLLANALFADGSSAVLVESKTKSKTRLSIEAFHNDLAFEGNDDMAWSVGDQGFEMKLSTYVPDVIRKGIATLTQRLLQKIDKKVSDVRYFAMHPGGKRILEAVEQELHLTPEQNAPAYHVLKNYGNMSSPTVLFVMNEILKNVTSADHDEHILSFAFGPGLTLESMLLKIETN